ncbi:HNH endonuclease [Candidatus Dependentiae bacterium]|nr:HNH endonuclease [Candidatus Dependentiae bacterium]
MDKRMKTFSFYGAYETADIVKKILHVDDGQFGSGHVESFIDGSDERKLLSLAKFSKITLLHGFILYCLNDNFNHEKRYIKKYGSATIAWTETIASLLSQYQINFRPIKLSDDDIFTDEIERKKALFWLDNIDNSLHQLWLKLADEAFHILFRDRMVLQFFNLHVANIIHDWDDLLTIYKTKKGYFKRCRMPSWLKKAIFHRDQGICVFCNKDLTGIYNTLSQKNFDHIVPLSQYGANDPTNIQLSCRDCNNQKSNKNNSTSDSYAKWW